MAKESVSWTQRIGGNRALVLGIIILILVLFTVESYVVPSFGFGSKGYSFIQFTVNGRVVTLDKYQYDNQIGDWQKYQMGMSLYTRQPRGGPEDFLTDLMLSELAKDAGITVTDGTLREYIQAEPQFQDSSGDFDPKAFDKSLQERFGGLRPRAYEEQVRLSLLVDHLRRLYMEAHSPADEAEAYKKWKGDYPKIEIAYTWEAAAPIRATFKVEDLKPRDIEDYWKNPSVQDRHKLPPRYAFEAAALRDSEVEDQAYLAAREAWKDDADLSLKKDKNGDEAYEFWAKDRKFEFTAAGQTDETIEALRKENEEAVKKEEEAAAKDPVQGPKDPAGPEKPPDLSKRKPDEWGDAEQYRRFWRHRVEKDLWLRKLFEKVIKEAKEGNRPLAEVAEKWSKPGLKIRILVQSDPVDQYGVEKIAGFGSPDCDLRYSLNGMKADQAGSLLPEVMYLCANHDNLGERGWEVARLQKVVPEEIPPLDTVKDKVAAQLLDERARDRARADLEALRKSAEDAHKSLEDAAKDKGMESAAAGPFNVYSWRPPTPRPAAGKPKEDAKELWKDANRRVSSIMSRYAALRDTPGGAFGPVLDDTAGTGAFYLAQVKRRTEPSYEEMSQAQLAQVRKGLFRDRFRKVAEDLSYMKLKDRLGLLVAGKPGRDPEKRGQGE